MISRIAELHKLQPGPPAPAWTFVCVDRSRYEPFKSTITFASTPYAVDTTEKISSTQNLSSWTSMSSEPAPNGEMDYIIVAPGGDLVLAVASSLRLLVSRETLIKKSPVFEAMLRPGVFAEGCQIFSRQTPGNVNLPEDDVVGMEILCCMLHFATHGKHWLLKDALLSDYAAVERMADKYMCTNTIATAMCSWRDNLTIMPTLQRTMPETKQYYVDRQRPCLVHQRNQRPHPTRPALSSISPYPHGSCFNHCSRRDVVGGYVPIFARLRDNQIAPPIWYDQPWLASSGQPRYQRQFDSIRRETVRTFIEKNNLTNDWNKLVAWSRMEPSFSLPSIKLETTISFIELNSDIAREHVKRYLPRFVKFYEENRKRGLLGWDYVVMDSSGLFDEDDGNP